MATTRHLLPVLTNRILMQTCEYMFPILNMFGGSFTDQELVCGQTALAKIKGNIQDATITNCCPSGGGSGTDYCNGGNAPLFYDVPIVLDKKVQNSIKLNGCDLNNKSVEALDELIMPLVQSLIKQVLNEIYSNITAANFPLSVISQAADVDPETLDEVADLLDDADICDDDLSMILNGKSFRALNSYLNAAVKEPQTITGNCNKRNVLNCINGWDTYKDKKMPDNGEGLNGFSTHPNAIRWVTAVERGSEDALNALGVNHRNKNIEFQSYEGFGIKVAIVESTCNDDIFLHAGFLFGAQYGGTVGSGADAIDLSTGLVRITEV